MICVQISGEPKWWNELCLGRKVRESFSKVYEQKFIEISIRLEEKMEVSHSKYR